MKNTRKDRRAGFTIMEVLVALVITVMVAGGIASAFLIVSRIFYAGSEQLGLQAVTGYALEEIITDISGAEEVSVSAGGDRIDLKVPKTNLSADITGSANTIPVNWTKFFPSWGVAYIGDEAIYYGGKTATSLTNCTRGYAGTTAASHVLGDIVYSGPIYYLNSNRIYVCVDGSPSLSSDRLVLSNVIKYAGRNLFELIPKGGDYKTDRVTVAFACFQDDNGNAALDPEEPGLDCDLEMFPRNMR